MYLLKKHMKVTDKLKFMMDVINYVKDTLKVDAEITISIDNSDYDRMFGGARCETDYIENTPRSRIIINQDVFDIINELDVDGIFRNRVVTYLDALEVEYNWKSQFVFSLLHELGHADLFNTMCENNEGSEHYSTLFNISTALMATFDSYKVSERYREMGIDVGYLVDAIEAQADIFAYKHFPSIWKSLS